MIFLEPNVRHFRKIATLVAKFDKGGNSKNSVTRVFYTCVNEYMKGFSNVTTDIVLF